MAAPDATPTPITPPYVPIIDPRTGQMDRAWYMFFLSLFQQTQNIDNPLKNPQAVDQSGELASILQAAQLASQNYAAILDSAQTTQLAAQSYDASVDNAQNTQLAAMMSAVQADIAALQTSVQGLALARPVQPLKRSRYGMFYDTTTQAATAINTATLITFNTTSLTRGVYLGSPTSRIYIDTPGIYDFQTSIQLDSTVATDEHFYLWLRKNGADIADSASTVRLKGNNSELILTLNFFLDLKADDYVEFVYSTTNTGVQLLYAAAAAPVPAIPSIIVTVNNNI